VIGDEDLKLRSMEDMKRDLEGFDVCGDEMRGDERETWILKWKMRAAVERLCGLLYRYLLSSELRVVKVKYIHTLYSSQAERSREGVE
jgi:hypothetical protein